MSTKTEKPQTAIRLNDDDIRTGIQLELAAARAQAHLQGVIESAQMFREQVRVKYNVPDTHEMTDWLMGFVPVQKE
ncbi:MAG: hypothetical protein KDE58_30885 [Caldilineaceae bacterium]|nr:hypothetical protein [Caldilineaceae bacterium]